MVFSSLRHSFSPRFNAAGNDNGENPMVAHRSSLKDFLVSIASMSGDLSNITAPPFVLDTKSVVEIPSYWAEIPSLFVSPATSEDPIERGLLILKSFLMGMKSQTYMGHSEETGVKKPLNAFLGELFIGRWEDEETGPTYLVSEQVSHHPPITACRTWNPKHGIVAEGYNRQKITFSMSSASVNVGASGFALKSIEKYDEHYLLPLPDFRVKGVLSGAPYPETEGDWYITSTSGYMSKVSFSGGKGFFGGGTKHGFKAILYKEEDGETKPIYTLEGAWNSKFTIKDEREGKIIETVDMVEATKQHQKIQIDSLEDMDPWESRRAWHDTAEAIRKLDFGNTSAAKGFLEQGQRDMRKEEQQNGTKWEQAFFKNSDSHPTVEKLMAKLPGGNFMDQKEKTCGVWSFDQEAWDKREKPYHPGLEPDNIKEGQQRVYRNGSRASFQASGPLLPRNSMASSRQSIDSARFAGSTKSRNSTESERSFKDVDEKVGAVEDGRPAKIDGVKVDIGRQPEKKEIHGITKDEPEPQHAQLRSREEELGSGIEGLSVKDKVAVEDMLRDTYSS